MNRTLSLHPLSVVVGASLVALVAVLGGMTPLPAAPVVHSPAERGLLLAKDIVNLDSAAFVASQGDGGFLEGDIILGFGETASVYTVPADRHLVLTHLEVRTLGQTVQLVEDTDRGRTIKRSAAFLDTSNGETVPGGQLTYFEGVGLTFAPKAEVVLWNNGDSPAGVSFHMSGYLAKQ